MNANELRDALHAYMKRTDPETIANEPTALELARQVIEKVFFPLESEEWVSPPLPVVNGSTPLPDDFGRAVSVGRNFAYIAPRLWQRLSVDAPHNLAGSYSIFAGRLHVEPSISALALVYNARPLAIAGTEENWLSVYYAPMWLNAARAEQYRFIEDAEGENRAENLWRNAVGEFDASSERRRQSGGALRMKSR